MNFFKTVSKFISIALAVIPSLAGADEEEVQDIDFDGFSSPWFTGPLIAPSGYTVKPGHFIVQPFFETLVSVGAYNGEWQATSFPNFYTVGLRTRLKAGVCSWLDLQLNPQISYKETQGQSSFGFADLPFHVNIQLLTFQIEDPWPALRLNISTSIPCGKYKKLNPSKLGTDAFGTGSWYPEIALVSSKLWHLRKFHYLEARLFSGYRIGTATSVKGLSIYGGDPTSFGMVYPGNIFFVDAALQYNFSMNWALACDISYLHRNRSRFSGRTSAPVGIASSEQYSLAPALEYNFSKNCGMIGGVWFSLAGRNSSRFINGLVSLNSYF